MSLQTLILLFYLSQLPIQNNTVGRIIIKNDLVNLACVWAPTLTNPETWLNMDNLSCLYLVQHYVHMHNTCHAEDCFFWNWRL